MGLPIGPGFTDTIVQRQADAIVSPGGTASPIPIQIVALSLESTQPIPLPTGATSYVYVTLNPADLAEDTGQMTITENSTGTGGTFTSFFDVFFDVCLQPGANGVGCASGTSPIYTNTTALTLSNSGANWSNTPSPGSVLVVGPFGDQSANTHTGLPSNYEDFYLQGTLTESESGGTHVVDPATTPEPNSLALWATGLLVVGLLGKKFFTGA
jgi:hypothetical protein